MTNRFVLLATAAAASLAGFGAAPVPQSASKAPTAPAANIGSITSVDRAKTLPCQRFRQTPDGSWTMIGPVEANGTTLENVTFSKGTAEAAVLGQRCVP